MNKEDEIRLEKCLELRNLLIDKLIIGVFIACVVGASYFALEAYKSSKAKEIEVYKDTQSQKHYLLESRLSAIFELREIHSNMEEILYKLMFELPANHGHQDERQTMVDKYREDVSRLIHTYNKWGALFSDDLDLALQRHLAVHQAFAYNQVSFSPDYYEFMVNMGLAFYELTQVALHEEGFGEKVEMNPDLFQPAEWSREKMMLGAAAYFQATWGKWRAEREKDIENTPIPLPLNPPPESSANIE